MRNTAKVHFALMQIIDLVAGITILISPAVLGALYVLGIVKLDSIGLRFPVWMLFIIVVIAVLIIAMLLFKASLFYKRAILATDEELVQLRGGLFAWGIISAVITLPSAIGCILVLVITALSNGCIARIKKELNAAEIKESEAAKHKNNQL